MNGTLASLLVCFDLARLRVAAASFIFVAAKIATKWREFRVDGKHEDVVMVMDALSGKG